MKDGKGECYCFENVYTYLRMCVCSHMSREEGQRQTMTEKIQEEWRFWIATPYLGSLYLASSISLLLFLCVPPE